MVRFRRTVKSEQHLELVPLEGGLADRCGCKARWSLDQELLARLVEMESIQLTIVAAAAAGEWLFIIKELLLQQVVEH